MSGQQKTEDNPWMISCNPLILLSRTIDRLLKHRLALLLIGANLTGACIVTVYFSFFDKIRPIGEVNNVAMIVLIMFVCLTCIASRLEKKWSEDLNRFIQLKINDMDVTPDLFRSAQRKILNLPYIYSLISFINWCLASLIMSTYTVYNILYSGGGEKAGVILFEAFRT